jgi:hypothetical protein
MMKRLLVRFAFFPLVCFVLGCATTGPGSISSLDQAIEAAANDINNSLHDGAAAVVINFSASSKGLSEYVLEELTGKLVSAKKLIVVDRGNLELIQ